MLSWLGWGSSSKQTQEKPQLPAQQQPQNDIPPPSPPKQQQPQPLITPGLKLLLGGMSFFAFSLLITRRAMIKKRIAGIPPYYTSSTYHKPDVNGAAEALEALSLATVNVASFGMMFTGGLLYKFNINGMDDLRTYVRAGMMRAGDDGPVKSDEELEAEIGEWMFSIMGKKAQQDFLEKKAELEMERKKKEDGAVAVAEK